jgi:hypothetical protein
MDNPHDHIIDGPTYDFLTRHGGVFCNACAARRLRQLYPDGGFIGRGAAGAQLDKQVVWAENPRATQLAGRTRVTAAADGRNGRLPLLHNRSLQAVDELGISEAERAQAFFDPNPGFSFRPDERHRGNMSAARISTWRALIAMPRPLHGGRAFRAGANQFSPV